MNDDRKDKDLQNMIYPVGLQPNVSVPGSMNPIAQQVVSALSHDLSPRTIYPPCPNSLRNQCNVYYSELV